jgi:hypothetical protein
MEGDANDDMSLVVEMTFRIFAQQELFEIGGLRPATLEEIEAFRIHVVTLRLRGHLRQEVCMKLLVRADAREAELQASQKGATTASPSALPGTTPHEARRHPVRRRPRHVPQRQWLPRQDRW